MSEIPENDNLPQQEAPAAMPSNPQAQQRQRASQLAQALRAELRKAVIGQNAVIDDVLTALIAGGHVLVEGVPGLGKTLLVRALARCFGGEFARIQFTPDLMPSDVTGVSVFDRQRSAFQFRPGPVFSNVLVADEINRASPKTQSALLEAMEERQVSVDGTTHLLARPFLVLATQNPVEMEGTFPLPEAQRDRFLAQTTIGYPDVRSELDMLADRDHADPLEQVRPVADAETMLRLTQAVASVHIAPAVRSYLVGLVRATREAPRVRLGASPRATLHLARAAKAWAALAGRDYVVPDDVAHLAVPVLAHRIMLAPVGPGAVVHSPEEVVASLVRSAQVPRGASS